MTSLQPTPSSERHSLLDVLRGFALLGVLLANMATHSGYFFLSEEGKETFSTAHVDHYVSFAKNNASALKPMGVKITQVKIH